MFSLNRSAGGFRVGAGLAILLFLVLGAALAFAPEIEGQAPTQFDHARVVGPNECAECHKDTVALWRTTQHSRTFAELPRRKEANEIARRMGLKRIKAGSLCLNCHFTTAVVDGDRRAIAGISCESCHGPGRGYLKRHSEFSGKKKETETAMQAASRWADSEAAGMIRPHALYSLAKNCYACHTVPQEKLVNEGGHPAGSRFELVSWSQGEVRHNVWRTGGRSNPEASTERKRMMYIIGLGVELETSLRAVGAATMKAKYAVSMAKRAKRAELRFAKVAEALGKPEFDEILSAARSAKLKLNNGPALGAAADKIAAAIQQILAKHDGSAFVAIDSLIPGPDKYKGQPTK